MKMSEIYLAGKVSKSEISISQFADELEDQGHHITLKWWELGQLPKPYLEQIESSRPAAAAMTKAVMDSQVFILFAENNILGAATEFGVALGDSMSNKNQREIIVYSPEDIRQSVFYAHPDVITVRSLAEIRQRPWY